MSTKNIVSFPLAHKIFALHDPLSLAKVGYLPTFSVRLTGFF